MRSTFTFGLLAVAGFSVAQEQYSIDPETVQDATRDYWCQQQKAVCPSICLQQPGVESQNTVSNDCDPDSLVANCVCDNGLSPNLTQFTQTLPYNICTQWGTNCVADCAQADNACKDACRSDHPCGAQDPYKGNATTTSASQSATAAPTGSSTENDEPTAPLTGFAGQTATADDEPGAASSFGASYGLAVTIVGLFASLALL